MSANTVIEVNKENEEILCPLSQTESEEDVRIEESLSDTQKQELKSLLRKYRDVFTDVAGKTLLVECEINLTDDTPIRRKPFPVPLAVREVIRHVNSDVPPNANPSKTNEINCKGFLAIIFH